MLDSSLLSDVTSHTRFTQQKEDIFTSVSTDTRTIQNGALFVPLVGENFDGHQFIKAAIEAGAKGALWQKDKSIPIELPAHFQLYYVEDTLTALQKMAKTYRERINPTVIGITGSNGKTTTKDILASILSQVGETYKTQGNYNNHIGLPLTILQMPASCKYLILEMGMSDFEEIAFLSELATPSAAIVTNIGESHMEQLGSRPNIAKAKMEIVRGLHGEGSVYIDGDEPLLEEYYEANVVRVGFQKLNDIIIENIEGTEEGYTFTCGGSEYYSLPLLGKHNIKNAGYCIALAKKLNIAVDAICKGLEQLSLTGMRLERSKGSKGETIINDSYNASPTSMIAALDTLKALPHFSKYIAVLGDMYELGSEEEALHRKVATAIDKPITDLIFIGEKARWIAEEWNEIGQEEINVYIVNTKDEGANYLKKIVDGQSVVLFKASRGMRLEEVIQYYQEDRKGDDK